MVYVTAVSGNSYLISIKWRSAFTVLLRTDKISNLCIVTGWFLHHFAVNKSNPSSPCLEVIFNYCSIWFKVSATRKLYVAQSLTQFVASPLTYLNVSNRIKCKPSRSVICSISVLLRSLETWEKSHCCRWIYIFNLSKK